MRSKQVKITNLIIIYALTFLMLMFSLLPYAPAVVNAESDVEYTSVLVDLYQDDNFTIDDYPSIEDDYSLQVVQIAESEDDELFVYVYSPNPDYGKYVASSINITLQNDNNTMNYKLTLLNYATTLQKYLVEDLTISDDEVRYYEITSIFREFDEDIDEGVDNDNIINEVSYTVGKLFTITEQDGEVQVDCNLIDVIEITDKYVGFVRYSGINDDNWINESCDRYFVAFTTDKDVDKILEADIYYQSQSVYLNYLDNYSIANNNPFTETYGDIITNYAHLSFTDEEVSVSVGSRGLIGSGRYFTYEWDGIQTIDEFLSSVNVENVYKSGLFNVSVQTQVTDEAIDDLKDMQWVLSFDATDYSFEMGVTGGGGKFRYTIISNVSILRLKFEYDGIVYNLGVVDNKQTSSDIPINDTIVTYTVPDWLQAIIDWFNSLGTGLKIVFYVILALIAIFILLWVIKIVVSIIKSIASIFKKRR